jgi:hypothetical protein
LESNLFSATFHPFIEGELFKEKKYTIHPLRVSISKKSTDCFYGHFGFQNALPSFLNKIFMIPKQIATHPLGIIGKI